MNMTLEEAIDIIENKIQIDVRLCTKEEVEQYIEALTMACSALRPVTREQVEKVWRGEWKHYLPPLGAGNVQCCCTRCGRTPDVETPFCAWCGAAMTDEAVDILLWRLEALKDEID